MTWKIVEDGSVTGKISSLIPLDYEYNGDDEIVESAVKDVNALTKIDAEAPPEEGGTPSEEVVNITDAEEKRQRLNAILDGRARITEGGSEDVATKSLAALAEVLGKEWTGPHQGEQGGTYWLNPSTGERRYQEEKPDPGEGEEEAPAADEGGEEPAGEQGGLETVDGELVSELDPEDLEEGDTVMIHGTEFEAASSPVFEDPTGEQRVRLELENGDIYTPKVDDVQGIPLGEDYDITGYDVETEWGAKLANGVNTGELGQQGADGFVGVRDIQHHASDIEDTDLLADVLQEELENRNSASATGALESRIRALGMDPQKLLDERGYGKTEGGTGGEGEYPIDAFDDVREHIDDFADANRNVFNAVDRFGTRDKGIQNREHWEAIAERADTEDLEYMRGKMAKDVLASNLRQVEPEEADEIDEMSVEEALERYPDQMENQYKDDMYDMMQMVSGLLYYRRESDVGVDDIYDISEGENYDKIDGTTDEMRQRTKEVMDQVDPAVGAALSAHTGDMKVGRPDNKSWNGVYMSTTGNIKSKDTDKKPNGWGSPSTVAHELGHSLHYMMGISGGGDWGNNDRGEPNEKRVDTPIDELRMATGMDRDEMSEEDFEAAGWDPDTFGLAKGLEEEWERYQKSQLTDQALDVRDLDFDEQYFLEGYGVEAEFVDQVGDELHFETEDGEEYRLRVGEVDVDDRVKPVGTDVKQLRSYQAKGLHEFFTVTFSHWVADRERLEDHHPEMVEVYDEHFKPATKEEKYDELNFPDSPSDVEMGQEVLFTEGGGKPDVEGEITDIREGGVRVDDEHGGHWVDWDQIAWRE